jgi:hypothetical protein
MTPDDTTERPRGSAHATRLVAALLLCALAILPLRAGTALPPWIIRLGDMAGLDGDHAARWLAALFASCGLLAALWPAAAPRAIAIGGALAVLAGLASIGGAAALAGTSSIAAAVLVASIVVTAVGLGCAGWLAPRAAAPSRSRGASVAWQLLGGITALTFTLGLAAAVPVRSTRPLMTATLFDSGGTPADPSASAGGGATAGAPVPQMITFELDAWEGRSLAETGLYAYLPELAALVRDGTVFLIFYNPRCGQCHELFEAYFTGALTEPVIAIEIPPPPGVPMAESDQPVDINCPECQRLSLPPTHMWGVTPPAVVRVHDGMVECAVEANAFEGRDCISR